jgi:hypothetical protein
MEITSLKIQRAFNTGAKNVYLFLAMRVAQNVRHHHDAISFSKPRGTND